MQRPIMTSVSFLRRPSEPANAEDLPIADDLKDTLEANRSRCVGMAANMIGQRKRIIVVQDGPHVRLMYNPVIVEHTNEYQTEEGCLSLPGTRPATRWRRIRVSYLDEDFAPRTETFTGYTAQIIQHEVDHCDGVLI